MASRKFFVCKMAQRGEENAVEFAVFVARTSDILKWAGVRRVGAHEKGTQRILKQTRVKAIKKFLRADIKNTIPTSVILAFAPEIAAFESLQQRIDDCLTDADVKLAADEKVDYGFLTFDFEEDVEDHLRPALIVDGQHRLQGMSELEEDIPILVVALLDASPDEQAFQFVVINNKAAKVPTDNVKAIISNIDENILEERLLGAGVNYGDKLSALRDVDSQESSPFYHLLDWPLNPELEQLKANGRKPVNLTTIESCLRDIRNGFPEIEDDEDTVKEVFLAVWAPIKEHFSSLWAENSQFMSKVNIIALNEFVVDRLGYLLEGGMIDIYNPEKVTSATLNIIEAIPYEFWSTEWIYPPQDNAVVKNRIRTDLKTISQNRRAHSGKSWNDNLQLIGEL